MLPNLPTFQYKGKTQEERDKELTDYLFKLREELEDVLTNLSSDNLSPNLYNTIKIMSDLLGGSDGTK